MPPVGQFEGLFSNVARQTGAGAGKAVEALGAVAAAVRSVGEAAAAALGPLTPLANALAGFGRAIGTAVLAPLRTLATDAAAALRPLAPLGAEIGAALGTAAKAAVGVTGAFAGFTLATAGVVGAIAGIGQALVGFVQKANPVAAMQFNLALDDLVAVLGQTLTPILNVITGVIRKVADALTAVVPAGGGLAAAIQPLADLLGDVLAGAIGYIAQVVKGVTPVLIALSRVLAELVRWAASAVRDLLALVGIEIPGAEPGAKGSSVGAAARGASIGSVESVIAKAQQSAFQLGTGASPAAKTASEAEKIRTEAERIYRELVAFKDDVFGFGRGVLDGFGSVLDFLARLVPELGKGELGGVPIRGPAFLPGPGQGAALGDLAVRMAEKALEANRLNGR